MQKPWEQSFGAMPIYLGWKSAVSWTIWDTEQKNKKNKSNEAHIEQPLKIITRKVQT